MVDSARTSAGPAHLVSGTAMVACGVAGLSQYWDALGMVARGSVPFLLLLAGLVIVGAGVRGLREHRGISPSAKALTPIVATVACCVLAAAAATDLQVDLPRAWTPSLVSGYLALGLISGVVGGMLGLGGGLVHLSGLTLLFGFPFAFARGATLINNIFINGAAAVRYGRRGFLVLHLIVLLLPTALVGIAAGALLQAGFEETVMRRIFAIFVVIVTVALVIDTFRPPRSLVKRETAAPIRHGITGTLAGLLSGILGISGGVVAVPGQTLLTGVPLRNAIANSTLITAVSSALGSLLLLMPGAGGDAINFEEMITIAVLFVPGNLIGGHFGARWMERLPVVAVRIFFVTALVGIALRAWGVFG